MCSDKKKYVQVKKTIFKIDTIIKYIRSISKLTINLNHILDPVNNNNKTYVTNVDYLAESLSVGIHKAFIVNMVIKSSFDHKNSIY